jgi:hypothetical protein
MDNYTITYVNQTFEGGCHNPSLGFATKAKTCKVAGQEGNLGVTSRVPGSAKECEGSFPNIPKWIPIVGVGVPNGLPNL